MTCCVYVVQYNIWCMHICTVPIRQWLCGSVWSVQRTVCVCPVLKHPSKYTAEVIYRGYGPTYCNIYTIYYGECTTDIPLPKSTSLNNAIVVQKFTTGLCDHLAMLKFIWLRSRRRIHSMWRNGLCKAQSPHVICCM